MPKTILITGCSGMLGSEALELFRQFGYNTIESKRSNFNICDLSQVRKFFAGKKIDYVLHAAAYSAVDNAEEEKDLAFAVNAKGTQNIAIAANECAATIIYISTDYVFDGKKKTSYEVSDQTNPINVYGASKLDGEKNVMANNPKHYIIRTSWLYGKNGKNFVETMINLSKIHKEIQVIDDQFGCPTLTTDLIFSLRDLLARNAEFGIYHLCGSESVSWFEFAKKIFAILQIKTSIIPISSKEYKRAATRPKYSAMNNGGLLRHWQEALHDYLESKNLLND